MNNIFLETDRLILRRLEESDFPDYAAYAVDDKMSRMMGRPILKTEEDIRINFNWLKDMEPRCYGIMEKSRSHLIGNLSVCAVPAQLTGLEQLQGKQGCTLSYCICRTAQRKGYAAEAVRAVIAELFNAEQMDFVQCGCLSIQQHQPHGGKAPKRQQSSFHGLHLEGMYASSAPRIHRYETIGGGGP